MAAAPGGGERELASALRGRVAGAPVRCIDYSTGMSTRVIEGVGILYEGAGNTIYLNRPNGNLRALSGWNIPVTRIQGGSLCQREIINMVDSSTRSLAGMVSLGAFVPYRRVR
jgi:hypothetical protein